MAARLRRILTGLLVLALTLGATAELRGVAGSSLTEARSLAAAPAITPAIAASSASSAVPELLDLTAAPLAILPDTLRELDVRRHLGSQGVTADPASEPKFTAGPAVERASAADRIRPLFLPTDLILAGTASDLAEPSVDSRRPATPGQRAPPAV